jgi:hypothetical protein
VVVVDLPPVVDAGPDMTGDEGASIALRGSATDDRGTPTSTWTYTAGPDVDPGATCAFGDAHAPTTTISCTDDGTFTVTLTAGDGVNTPVRDTAQVRLANVPPQVHMVAPQPWRLFKVGDSVPASVTFTDAANDTHTCRITWDDGRTDTITPAGHACAGTHRFAHAGMFTIDITVTDDDGGQGTGHVMVVVYDPRAGVPQGNGWRNGPGQEGFDFTASYPSTAATVPDGAVTFSLPPSANLNLRNHQHLDWLVATPDGRFAIKGIAERIPGQQVAFVLYGYDGCPPGQTTGCQPGPDRLRMVVWDTTAHGPVPEDVPLIYDNRAGQPFDIDTADPQPIQSGVIVIQHPPML